MYIAYRTEEGTNKVLPQTLFLYYFTSASPGYRIHVPNNMHKLPAKPWEWDFHKNVIFSCNDV